MKDKLLTIKEVAKYLRVSERSVLRYIEAERLVAVKVGYWRVKEKDLNDFISKNTNGYKNKKRK
ncbi:MAG: helix-turn-helix domain-containing protein [Candidatus Pacebacteria bacterium]|jgi:excisionase family DNA binding protein|nr:helix-turn-helix domain-containing protein [Candidatus Paceibacterota bacterium]